MDAAGILYVGDRLYVEDRDAHRIRIVNEGVAGRLLGRSRGNLCRRNTRTVSRAASGAGLATRNAPATGERAWRRLCGWSSMPAWLFVGPIKALLVAAAVFIPFERLAGLHATQLTFRRGWVTDVLIGLMNGLLLYAVLLVVLGGLDAVAAAGAPQLRNWVGTRPLWAQGLLALAIGDLGVYAIHRLQHAVPWLWRFHAVHHSAEEMDWLVGFRFHPVDLLLLRVASLGPLVALHVTPSAIAIYIAISGWQSSLVHANVRVPYGPLRWLLVSPEFHHWHHSAEREAHDRNYGSLIASWDLLFGTVHLPRGRQPLRYGADERLPAGWVQLFLHPFRRRGAPAEEPVHPAGNAENRGTRCALRAEPAQRLDA